MAVVCHHWNLQETISVITNLRKILLKPSSTNMILLNIEIKLYRKPLIGSKEKESTGITPVIHKRQG